MGDPVAAHDLDQPHTGRVGKATQLRETVDELQPLMSYGLLGRVARGGNADALRVGIQLHRTAMSERCDS